jgi:hypothetical protein
MHKQSTTTFLQILVPVLLFAFIACKKEDPATNNNQNQNPVKELNKTTFTPKKWQTQGGSTTHDFKTGGVYGAKNGTWMWRNLKSDTMLIVTQSGFPETQWKFYWNTDHEMEGENLSNHILQKFRDTAW